MELQIFSVLFIPLLIDAFPFPSPPVKPTIQTTVTTGVGTPPLVISHRGDKISMPEHTLGAYEFAMIARVDYVEPDLMVTKDAVLVCYHDITLSRTTDVSSRPEFAHLMTPNRTLLLDGQNVTFIDEWFVSDFTLAQLQTLRVVQEQVGIRPQFFNQLFTIPTFQQYLDAIHAHTLKREVLHHGNWTPIGIIPELKYPKFHNTRLGLHGMEAKLLSTLISNGYPLTPNSPQNCKSSGIAIPCSPAIIQCYDVDTITFLSQFTSIPLMTLVDNTSPRYLTYGGFQELSNRTAYIGIWKELLFTGTLAEIGANDYDHDEIAALGGFIPPNEIVKVAHRLGMKLVIYTIYDAEEPSLRGCDVKCTNDTKTEELDFYFKLGVDGMFVEGLADTLRIRDNYYSKLVTQNNFKESTSSSAAAIDSMKTERLHDTIPKPGVEKMNKSKGISSQDSEAQIISDFTRKTESENYLHGSYLK